MGLAICKSVMLHHHGSLKYESVVGAYTTVTMRFPAADYLRLESPEQTDQVKRILCGCMRRPTSYADRKWGRIVSKL